MATFCRFLDMPISLDQDSEKPFQLTAFNHKDFPTFEQATSQILKIEFLVFNSSTVSLSSVQCRCAHCFTPKSNPASLVHLGDFITAKQKTMAPLF